MEFLKGPTGRSAEEIHAELERFWAEDKVWKAEMDRQTILESNRRDELDESEGSAGRYEVRKKWFREDGDPYPELRHYVLWFIHNCVAHPALGFFPNRKSVQFHVLTSCWLNKVRVEIEESERYPIPVPVVPDKKAWLIHNVVAHVAIGICPMKWAFDFHDATAEEMKVPGWV